MNEQKHHYFRILISATIFILFSLMFWPFYTPILFAALFAFALENTITKLSLKYKSRQIIAATALLILFLFVATPLVIISLKTISTIKDYSSGGLQNTEFYKLTEHLLTSLTGQLNFYAQKFDLDLNKLPQPSDLLSQSASLVASGTTTLVTKIPQLTLALFVFLASLYYFLVESAKIKKFFIYTNVLTSSELTQLIEIIKKSSFLTLVASAVIGSLQALIVASFGYFCGFTEFILLFVITFIFSLIPVIGAGPVAFFLTVLAFVQGQTAAAIGMLIAALVASSLDNFIKPLIVNSSSDELHPIVALLALIGAIFVYGAPGILLGPILTQLAFKIIPILFRENK